MFRKILTILLVLTFVFQSMNLSNINTARAEETAQLLYVSASATSSGKGTKEEPLDFNTAVVRLRDGGEMRLLPGVYNFSEQIIIKKYFSGKSDARKYIIADGEVIFDFSGHKEGTYKPGIALYAWNWVIKGLHIRYAGGNGMLVAGNYNVIENCVFESNGNTGLQLSRDEEGADTVADWPSYNLIKNCTSYNNCDAHNGGEDADGFAAKVKCGEGNVFDGCISYNNSDDGWDLFAKEASGPIGSVTIRNCVAFRNGILLNGEGTPDGDGNGFKLGGMMQPTVHTVVNCLAFENIYNGFTDNNNPSALVLKNCTSVNNGLTLGKIAKNYGMSKEVDGVNQNLLSYADSGWVIGRDRFIGTLERCLYMDAADSYRLVNEKTAFEINGRNGLAYAVSDEDFYNVTTPATSAAIHSEYRKADGTIDMKGLFEIKKGNVLATAATDGGSLGARLSNEQAYTETENPGLMNEAYTMPTGDWEEFSDYWEGVPFGIIENDFEIDGFTVTATPEKTVQVELSSAVYEPENLSFPKKVIVGGRGAKSYRSVVFTATAQSIFCLYAGNSLTAGDREMVLCSAAGEVIERQTLVAGKTSKLEFEIPADGQYYVMSSINSWMLYKAALTGKTTGHDPEPEPEPEVHEGLEVFPDNTEEQYVYTGSAICPKVTVLYDGVPLVMGEDYTVKYTNNINASARKPAVITVKSRGKGHGRWTRTISFEIKPAEMSLVFAGTSCQASGGRVKMNLCYKGKALAARDYRITAVNDGTVKLTGKGNFQGSADFPYVSAEKSKSVLGFRATFGKEKLSYDGTEKAPSLTVYDKADKNKLLVEGTDYKVIYSDNRINAGKVRCCVVGIGSYCGIISRSYTIKSYKVR